MSYWEQNWRRNLKLITVDETPQSQQLQVSRWLKIRCEHLLGCSSDLEAECLIDEFDDLDLDVIKKFSRISITAGASAPESKVMEIAQSLESYIGAEIFEHGEDNEDIFFKLPPGLR